ncbi:S24 family peptidase [Helicobacter mastomyrinus]|uniref:S24 family peptidase n=1 Tax=Helicobacter mastomyrinus TaxID=287948 RepID=A0ABZ3F5C1_9HELI
MTGVEFREIREKLGMTQDTLSKEIGINIRQISRIETGEADVRDYHEKLILTLLEKRSKKYKNDVKTQKITYYPNIKASAGYGIINENEESIEIDTNLLSAIKMPHKKLDMIQVQGDSMHPYIQNGDFALIERSSEAKNGDIVIANYQGDLYVKQIQKNPQNKSISFISSNKEYPSFEVKGTDLESLVIVGILRGVIRAY